MGTSTVETQLTGAAAHIIKRPRLTKILDETEARIILLCAPAGYGKTTLAREWVATRSEPVYWYSGGPAMADVAALAVELGSLAAEQASDELMRIRAVASRSSDARTLARAVAAVYRGSPTLVLDDYHFATTNEVSERFVQELVSLTATRFVITSRVRPAWLRGRKVIYGEALALQQDALAFTREEAEEVLPGHAVVHNRARGWPAVIGLAALAGEPQNLAADIPPAELYDFIANDLLGGLSHSERTALLLLAAGGDASRDVARSLLGVGTESIVSRARDAGFLTRTQDGWVAMHPLLRSFLLARLAEESLPELTTMLRRVLDVLGAHEEWDAALTLLRVFQDSEAAASLLTEALVPLLDAGRVATVGQWVEIGEASRSPHPIFLLSKAEVALRQGDDIAAGSLGEAAARGLQGDLAARAHLVAARAFHQTDDADATDRNASRVEQVAESLPLKTEALWLLFANAYERDPNRMRVALDRLRSATDPRPEHAIRVASAEAFSWFAHDGNLLHAVDASARAVALASAVSDPLMRTNALNIYAQLQRACGRYAEALAGIPRLLEEAEAAGLDFVIHHALLARAGALIGMRDLDAARRTLREIDQRNSPSDHVQRNAVMLKARLRVAVGDLEGANILLAQQVKAPPALQAEYLSLRALFAAAAGDVVTAEQAMGDATNALQYAEPTLLIDLARAIVSTSGASSAKLAAEVVQKGLGIGGVDAVITACRACPEFASRAVKGGAGASLQSALAMSSDRDLGRRVGLEMPREFSRSPGLTRRELEVLDLLVAGRTNPEIAKTLFIGESTTKVHIRHIFEKLGVHSRAEAVAAAIDMKRD